jgi:WD40 repeat protein
VSSRTRHTDSVSKLFVMNDARYFLSGSYDNSVLIWDSLTMAVARSWVVAPGLQQQVFTVLQLMDGTIATGTIDGFMRLWQPDGKLLRSMFVHTPNSGYGLLSLLEIKSSGLLISGGADSKVNVYKRDNNNTLTLIKILINTAGYTFDLALLKNGLIAGSSVKIPDFKIRIWDISPNTTQSAIKVLSGHTNAVGCLVVLNDGT